MARRRITVTNGPSKGICTMPRSSTDPNPLVFAFTFALKRLECCKIITFEVTSPEICGGFIIKGVTEDGDRVEGMYHPPCFSRIFLNEKVVARNGSFITSSQFNPF